MQDYINCLKGVITPLILYSNVTFLSNNGKVTRYPLVLSLGNIACELWSQEKGHMLLVVLPMISTANIPSHQWRLHIFHQCFKKTLELSKWFSFKLVRYNLTY
jgi:hypothetical protein